MSSEVKPSPSPSIKPLRHSSRAPKVESLERRLKKIKVDGKQKTHKRLVELMSKVGHASDAEKLHYLELFVSNAWNLENTAQWNDQNKDELKAAESLFYQVETLKISQDEVDRVVTCYSKFVKLVPVDSLDFQNGSQLVMKATVKDFTETLEWLGFASARREDDPTSLKVAKTCLSLVEHFSSGEKKRTITSRKLRVEQLLQERSPEEKAPFSIRLNRLKTALVRAGVTQDEKEKTHKALLGLIERVNGESAETVLAFLELFLKNASDLDKADDAKAVEDLLYKINAEDVLKGEGQRVNACFKLFVRLVPTCGKALGELGTNLNGQEAIKYLKLAVATQDPLADIVRYTKWLVFVLCKEHQYEKALEYAPNNVEALEGAITQCHIDWNFPKELQLIQTGLKMGDEKKWLKHMEDLASASFESGLHFDVAQACYDTLAGRNYGDQEEIKQKRVQTYTQLGNYAKALELDPNDSEALALQQVDQLLGEADRFIAVNQFLAAYQKLEQAFDQNQNDRIKEDIFNRFQNLARLGSERESYGIVVKCYEFLLPYEKTTEELEAFYQNAVEKQKDRKQAALVSPRRRRGSIRKAPQASSPRRELLPVFLSQVKEKWNHPDASPEQKEEVYQLLVRRVNQARSEADTVILDFLTFFLPCALELNKGTNARVVEGLLHKVGQDDSQVQDDSRLLDCYEKFVELVPRSSPSWVWIAHQVDGERAIVCLKKAIEVCDPSTGLIPSYRIRLAAVYCALGREEEALEEAPNDSFTLRSGIRSRHKKGNFAGALELVERAIGIGERSEWSESIQALGDASFEAQNFEVALRCFELQEDDKKQSACLKQLGRYSEALVLDPNDPEALLLKAKDLADRKQFTESFAALSSAVGHLETFDTVLQLAQQYIQADKLQLAEGCLKRLKGKQGPGLSEKKREVRHALGEAFCKAHQFEKALKCITHHIPSLLDWANLLQRQKKFESAYRRLREAFDHNRDETLGQQILAAFQRLADATYQKLSDCEVALMCFEVLDEQEHNMFANRDKKKTMYLLLEMYDDALEIAPKNVEALLGKARQHQEAGEYEEAALCLENALGAEADPLRRPNVLRQMREFAMECSSDKALIDCCRILSENNQMVDELAQRYEVAQRNQKGLKNLTSPRERKKGFVITPASPRKRESLSERLSKMSTHGVSQEEREEMHTTLKGLTEEVQKEEGSVVLKFLELFLPNARKLKKNRDVQSVEFLLYQVDREGTQDVRMIRLYKAYVRLVPDCGKALGELAKKVPDEDAIGYFRKAIEAGGVSNEEMASYRQGFVKASHALGQYEEAYGVCPNDTEALKGVIRSRQVEENYPGTLEALQQAFKLGKPEDWLSQFEELGRLSFVKRSDPENYSVAKTCLELLVGHNYGDPDQKQQIQSMLKQLDPPALAKTKTLSRGTAFREGTTLNLEITVSAQIRQIQSDLTRSNITKESAHRKLLEIIDKVKVKDAQTVLDFLELFLKNAADLKEASGVESAEGMLYKINAQNVLEGKKDRVVVCFKRFVRLVPKSGKALGELGKLVSGRERIEYLESAIASGDVAADISHYKECLADALCKEHKYREALKFVPNHLQALQGAIKQTQVDLEFSDALKYLQIVMNLNTQDQWADEIEQLGRLSFEQGQTDADFEVAATCFGMLNSERQDALKEKRIAVFHKLGQDHEVLKLDPRDPSSLANRATERFESGEYSQALTDIQQAVKEGEERNVLETLNILELVTILADGYLEKDELTFAKGCFDLLTTREHRFSEKQQEIGNVLASAFATKGEFEKALAIMPMHVPSVLGLIRVYIRQEAFGDALQRLREIFRQNTDGSLDQDILTVFQELADASVSGEYAEQALEFLVSKEFQVSENRQKLKGVYKQQSKFDRVLGIDPHDIEGLIGRAKRLQEDRRYGEAFADLKTALEVEAQPAVFTAIEGLARVSVENSKIVGECCELLAKHDTLPESLQQIYNAALMKQKKYKQVLARNSRNPQALRKVSTAHRKHGKLLEAFQGFQKALGSADDREKEEVFKEVAKLAEECLKKGETDIAFDCVNILPDNAAKAKLKAPLTKALAEKQHYEKALQVDPSHIPSCLGRATQMIDTGELEAAHAGLQSIPSSRDEQVMSTYRALGEAYFEKKAFDRAAACFELIPDAAERLITCYMRLETYDKVLAIDPENVDALRGQAREYIADVRYREAFESLEKAYSAELEALKKTDILDEIQRLSKMCFDQEQYALVERGCVFLREQDRNIPDIREWLVTAYCHQEKYQEALKVDPDAPDALFGLAVVKKGEGEYSDSLKLFQRAVNEGYKGLLNPVLSLGKSCIENDKLRTARQCFRFLKKKNADLAEEMRQDLVKALYDADEFEKVLEIDPKHNLSLILVASVTENLGEAFEMLKRVQPPSEAFQSINQLAEKRFKEGEKQETVICLSYLVEKGMPISEIGNWLEDELLESSENMTVFLRFINQSKFAKRATDLGLESLKDEKYDQAFGYFKRAVDVNLEVAKKDMVQARDWVLESPVDPNKLIEYLNLILRVYPNDPEMLKKRVDAKRMCGKFGEAITDCNTLLRVNEKDEFAYERRGIAYQAQGKTEQALNDFKEAHQLSPQRADILTNIASIYYGNQQEKEAVEYLVKAIASDPAYVPAMTLLSAIFDDPAEIGSVENKLCRMLGYRSQRLKNHVNDHSVIFDVFLALGAYYRQQKKMDLGWQCYDWVLSVDSNQIKALEGQLSICRDKKQVDEGENLCKRILEIDSHCFLPHEVRYEFQLEGDQTDQVLELLHQMERLLNTERRIRLLEKAADSDANEVVMEILSQLDPATLFDKHTTLSQLSKWVQIPELFEYVHRYFNEPSDIPQLKGFLEVTFKLSFEELMGNNSYWARKLVVKVLTGLAELYEERNCALALSCLNTALEIEPDNEEFLKKLVVLSKKGAEET